MNVCVSTVRKCLAGFIVEMILQRLLNRNYTLDTRDVTYIFIAFTVERVNAGVCKWSAYKFIMHQPSMGVDKNNVRERRRIDTFCSKRPDNATNQMRNEFPFCVDVESLDRKRSSVLSHCYGNRLHEMCIYSMCLNRDGDESSQEKKKGWMCERQVQWEVNGNGDTTEDRSCDAFEDKFAFDMHISCTPKFIFILSRVLLCERKRLFMSFKRKRTEISIGVHKAVDVEERKSLSKVMYDTRMDEGARANSSPQTQQNGTERNQSASEYLIDFIRNADTMQMENVK